MRALYKTITADTQVAIGDCYLDGVEFTHNDAAEMRVYNESVSSKTAAQRIVTLRVSATFQDACRMFEYPIKCDGIYVDYITNGLGTVYYHY